jgi:hypothetical protein
VSMSRFDELRQQYADLATAAGDTDMARIYQGMVLGIDVARGAAAEVLLARAEAGAGPPDWRRTPVNSGRTTTGSARTRNPDARSVVYALGYPDGDRTRYFYVGAAGDPSAQLKDYMRNDGAAVSCRPVLDKLREEGREPELEVLEETTTGQSMATKAAWVDRLTAEGHELTNQRRG